MAEGYRVLTLKDHETGRETTKVLIPTVDRQGRPIDRVLTFAGRPIDEEGGD